MEFTKLIDLASERLGGAAILTNDEFFAPMENLIRPGPAVWRAGEYTERGKWMDGWESRRRRTPGHDWCILRLGQPGVIRGVVVDTSFFTGNYPAECSIDACRLNGVSDEARLTTDSVTWTEILSRSALRGDTQNPFAIDDAGSFTHVRLNIFPDGGVARFRVHGVVTPDWPRLLRGTVEVDLAAAENGGLVVDSSDMHYGDRQNLIMPGQPLGMQDGWETKRRRGPGHDWVVVKLARAGEIRRAVIDTSFFKGNAPGSCSIEVCTAGEEQVPPAEARWSMLMPQTPLAPHTVHDFVDNITSSGDAVTHARLNIFPDGGVARLRLFGVPRS